MIFFNKQFLMCLDFLNEMKDDGAEVEWHVREDDNICSKNLAGVSFLVGLYKLTNLDIDGPILNNWLFSREGKKCSLKRSFVVLYQRVILKFCRF